MFINENMEFLLNNRNYLLPKFYLDFFFNLKSIFPVLTLLFVFPSQPFFLPMVIFSDEVLNLIFSPLTFLILPGKLLLTCLISDKNKCRRQVHGKADHLVSVVIYNLRSLPL